MSKRTKYCHEECMMYQNGCIYEVRKNGKPEQVSPGQICIHPEFDITEYFQLWAFGFASGIKLRETD